MNGGPGCSSLDGLLSELGPFHIREDGKTVYCNPYSWNKIANVLFLETPAGVGFSYSADPDYKTNDDQVASDNFLALQHFFLKFPQFKKNDFYITGESYGGVYVPTLSLKVIEESADINLKGFAIGNGYLDQQLLNNSLIFFAYYHGLYGKSIKEKLTNNCCNGTFNQESCDFSNPPSEKCSLEVLQVRFSLKLFSLNIYNLYANCQQKRLFSGSSYPCVDSSNIIKWLNQDTVREALHISADVQRWEVCSRTILHHHQMMYPTMKPQVTKLISSGKLRGLIYNGDVDMACDFLGNQWFVESLPFKATSEYSYWMHKGQVAGFYEEFGNLTYITIKGAGHRVPEDKPEPALKMISSFLYQKSFQDD